MSHMIAKLLQRDQAEKVRNALKKNHACYVLITCKEPNEQGEMEVEMTYEGDACLAAYLIESAQQFVDDDETF
jgi:hypothetical protein